MAQARGDNVYKPSDASVASTPDSASTALSEQAWGPRQLAGGNSSNEAASGNRQVLALDSPYQNQGGYWNNVGQEQASFWGDVGQNQANYWNNVGQ
jgi:hypothetical protein